MQRALVVALLLASCAEVDMSSAARVGLVPDLAGASRDERVKGYVQGSRFPRLMVEVDAVPGLWPRQSSMDRLASGLEAILDKPGGVLVARDGELQARGSEHVWTLGELDDLARATLDLEVPADTIKMHVIVVDGHYETDSKSSKVLGLAWSHAHMALFGETIRKGCEGSPGLADLAFADKLCASVELGIWTHETGHLLGLVGNGLPLTVEHRDEDHGAHDVNDACIMYWAYEGQAILDVLRDRLTGGDETPLGFDGACLADIEVMKSAAP